MINLLETQTLIVIDRSLKKTYECKDASNGKEVNLRVCSFSICHQVLQISSKFFYKSLYIALIKKLFYLFKY